MKGIHKSLVNCKMLQLESMVCQIFLRLNKESLISISNRIELNAVKDALQNE